MKQFTGLVIRHKVDISTTGVLQLPNVFCELSLYSVQVT